MPKRTDVPLSLFSGTNSELRPVDIPEGVSPDNQDIIFLPGSADSRGGTHKLYSDVLGGNLTTVYSKTFILPNGNPLTLSLYSDGSLYQEDVFNAPGIRTKIGNVAPGVNGFSCTADGAEFIAFHDGEHGIDVPLQLNNGFLDRVSQDGPAFPVTAADLNKSVAITNITGSAALTIALISQNGLVNTCITTAPHGFVQGQPVHIAVAAGNGFNGSYFIETVPTPTSFTVAAQTSGLTSATGGTVISNLVTVTCGAAHGLQLVPDSVTISGNANNNYNNGQVSTDAVGGTVENQASWNIASIVSPTVFTMAVNVGVAAAQAGGNVQVGGLISAGPHQVCMSFLFRSGHISKPCPISSWISAGGKQVQISNMSIGPDNVMARILFFTGAFGGNFFWIPTNVTSGAIATIIPDNSTTSVVMDFADNTLFAADAIDITGNDLFALHTLTPCLGFFFYASRLWAWREFNTVQRLLNMGFEGGILSGAPNNPCGWQTLTGGGTLINVTPGKAWQISGNGTGAPLGQIQQSAYQDSFNQTILSPNTQYTFWFKATASAAGLTGNVQAILSSASLGFSSTAQIPINTCPTTGGFVKGDFSLKTPAVIPADLLLTIQQTGLNLGATITLDEMMIVFTAQPYRETEFTMSYVNDFESFDGVTGNLGSTEDTNPILAVNSLRGTMYFQTTENMHQTRDNGLTEPGGPGGGWQVDQIEAVGAMSVNSMGPPTEGENWFMTASAGASGLGLYIFDGGVTRKISQEYQTWFDSINKATQNTSWVVNDAVNRRTYIGTPQGTAARPNLLLVLDYRELDGEGQISTSGPIHISYSGKMIASDLVRKWTRWNLTLNCGALLVRPGNVKEFCVGDGNGQAPSAAPGFGNSYFFDPAKLTDDDFGQIFPYYTTYFFITPEMEQQYQMGSHRHSYSYLTARVTGAGILQITPLMNELTNPLRGLRGQQLTSTLTFDIERTLQFSGERCAFRFAVTPLAGQTDVKFSIQRLCITMKEESYQPVAGPR
jgi:hypothetical protein